MQRTMRVTGAARSIGMAVLLLAVAWLATPSIMGGQTARADDGALDPAQKRAIEALIRDTLLKHPELVVEALSIYQQREEAAERQRQREAIVALRDRLERDPADPVLGNPEGDVTVVEFFDYQCGYCKRMLRPLLETVERDGGIRWVMKEFPVLGPVSQTAAAASLAAREQGLYGEFHTALMGYRGRLDEQVIFQVAREVGLDIETLRADMGSNRIAGIIRETRWLAGELGIRGTPAFVIGDAVAPGAIPAAKLVELIAAARAG